MEETEVKNELPEAEDTTPCTDGVLSVKYNKEIKEIPLDEAALLAQKGLKFDAVSPCLERLKKLACVDGLNMSDYISSLEKQAALKKAKQLMENCENEGELIEAIADMKESDSPYPYGFDELKAMTGITDVSQLPEEITEKAALLGRNIFDEYLRYNFKKEKEKSESLKAAANAAGKSIGSQTAKSGPGFDPVTARFLKGVWGNR